MAQWKFFLSSGSQPLLAEYPLIGCSKVSARDFFLKSDCHISNGHFSDGHISDKIIKNALFPISMKKNQYFRWAKLLI